MNNIKILDCTIRDGGYYTNWDFSNDLVTNYFNSFNKLPVDYLEIGYRSPVLKGYYGEFFYCPNIVLNKIKELSGKKLVIILNEKDVKVNHLPDLLNPCKGIIQMVRLAIDPQNLSSALILAEAIKKMGFEVGFNVMYMSKWKNQPDFLKEIKNVDGLADYFYMVDSYGGVFPKDVKEIYELVSNQTKVPIGFHGHNNLELALINSLTAIECGAKIIDSTITGMGRGAGNLKTELLLTALNATNNLEVDFNALSDVTDAFTNLQKEYDWGTNLPYMVSGANSLPQKDVMDWIGKRYYSINSIVRALENQKNKTDRENPYEKFDYKKQFENVLIIGGGSSAVNFVDSIVEFTNKFKSEELAIIHSSARNSSHFKDIKKEHFYCLVGNEGNRLIKTFKDFKDFNGTCVLPPSPRKMGTFVPENVIHKTFELNEINFTKLTNDSHTTIAIQAAVNLGAKNCYMVGFDGYSSQQMGGKEQELFIENDILFSDASSIGLNLISLTASKYKNLKAESLFSKI